MDMFNSEDWKVRVGGRVSKSGSLSNLKELEVYFVEGCIKRGLEFSYDVTANENLDVDTMGYTEWASCFIGYPLNNELRVNQILDADKDNTESSDWSSYFRGNLENDSANKYIDRIKTDIKPRKNLVVLLGSNKFRDVIDFEKLREIGRRGDVYFKPHPLTTHELVGLLKDNVGEDNVLPRDLDVYHFLKEADKVYGSTYTESILYSIMSGKEVEDIEMYGKDCKAGFYHINKWLFRLRRNKVESINSMLSSPMSGVFNPQVDKDWKGKMDKYLDYIIEEKEFYKGWYTKLQRAENNGK